MLERSERKEQSNSTVRESIFLPRIFLFVFCLIIRLLIESFCCRSDIKGFLSKSSSPRFGPLLEVGSEGAVLAVHLVHSVLRWKNLYSTPMFVCPYVRASSGPLALSLIVVLV
ncbi:hypothetical protein NitaMp160 (mitochondrion) [Nicotiana tabacum]|uniref:Uncharacterized protein n=1 Tax=Nicotiana tabacum TaxID=4097 RepID=Q5M9R5_TOBAC|nr:hypothetical protein NitaMp160 [Nicotiana tabacum]BAD83563.1 hypothetical protein [Nicotiana tabacum]